MINCQSFISNSEITSFSSKKNPSTEPYCVNSAQANVELVKTMSATFNEPSVVHGNNLLQGYKRLIIQKQTQTKSVTRRKQTLSSTQQVKKNKQVIWKKILAGSEWKLLLSKKNSHGLSTDMEKVLNVLYVKEQDCNWNDYVGFLNPITYWKMTKLYHLASIMKTLLDVNKTQTTQRWSRNGKEKGKKL